MKPKIVSFVPAVIWLIFSYILLTLPGKDVPSANWLDAIHFDKWVHIGMFGTLTFLFSFPFKKSKPANSFIYVLIPLLALAYGIGMEFVQKYFTVGRSCDVFDMIADGVGCLFGYLFTRYFWEKLLLRFKKQK